MQRFARQALAAVVTALALFLTHSEARAERVGRAEVVSVYAKTWNNYTRTRLPDGTFKPETYAFASGGRLDGSLSDPSIDNVTFLQVAGVVANAIKSRGFIGAERGKSADLLIFLSFGTTSGTDPSDYRHSGPQLQEISSRMSFEKNTSSASSSTNVQNPSGGNAMADHWKDDLESLLIQNELENSERDAVNQRNAAILGYGSELEDAIFLKPFIGYGREIIGEVEESRYFVVLKAYDFKELEKNHKKKLLWETRFSIARRHNRFDEQISNMANFAARFCGESRARIIRRELPEGKVEFGTPRVIETTGEKPATK